MWILIPQPILHQQPQNDYDDMIIFPCFVLCKQSHQTIDIINTIEKKMINKKRSKTITEFDIDVTKYSLKMTNTHLSTNIKH